MLKIPRAVVATLLAGIGISLAQESHATLVPYSSITTMTLTTPGGVLSETVNTFFSYNAVLTDQDTWVDNGQSPPTYPLVNDGQISASVTVNSMQPGWTLTAGGQNASGAITYTLSGYSLDTVTPHGYTAVDHWSGTDAATGVLYDAPQAADQQVHIHT